MGNNDPSLQKAAFGRLFDANYYLKSNLDVADAKVDPFVHYFANGEKEGRKPNLLFDPRYYEGQLNKKKIETRLPYLQHYLEEGAALGLNPSPLFLTVWYAKQYKEEVGHENPLQHFLANRKSKYRPNPFFSDVYYLSKYPDLKESEVDPLEHFITTGFIENRDPSESFSTRFYTSEYRLTAGINPLVHYLTAGIYAGLLPRPEKDQTSLASALGGSVNRTAEYVDTKKEGRIIDARVANLVAFYLPQYHIIPENDRWWGAGFTEWRNVAKAFPRFYGHYQPRIPGDLGYYDISETAAIKRQQKLAKKFGISAFCVYYYRFGQQRLLEGPLEKMVSDSTLTFPFLICWANENWTRSWDGLNKDVLASFRYDPVVAREFLCDLVRYIKSGKYYHVQGRPLLVMYRGDNIPDFEAQVGIWREEVKRQTGTDLLVALVINPFEDIWRWASAVDAFIEFPPHNLNHDEIKLKVPGRLFDHDFTGFVGSYRQAVNSSRKYKERRLNSRIVPGVMAGWDNTARKGSRGTVFVESSVGMFSTWLEDSVRHARTQPALGAPVVFVNAWNEWAEGTYLEPDVRYGGAYLKAAKDAVSVIRAPSGRLKILLVGHDAAANGAQLLLINIARYLQEQFGADVTVLLLNGGVLLSKYTAVCRTFVASDFHDNAKLTDFLGQFSYAILNTVASGVVAPLCERVGLRFNALIHELPQIIRSMGLTEALNGIANHAEKIVLPSDFCLQQLDAAFPNIGPNLRAKVMVRPQGLYPPAGIARELDVRRALGIAPEHHVVISLGYGDRRKGFDIFLNTYLNEFYDHLDWHFLWVGNLDPYSAEVLEHERSTRAGLPKFHHIPFVENPYPYIAGSNIFFLSSREDPFPTVAMEAWSLGVPVVAVEGTGGIAQLIANEESSLGSVVPHNFTFGQVKAAIVRESERHVKSREAMRTYTARSHVFSDYVRDLYFSLYRQLPKISAVVPNYNYGRYLADRLESIVGQTLPPFEIIVVDDCSTDDSVEVIKAVQESYPGRIKLIENKENSGSVFLNWRIAVGHCTGEYVWICEADDLSDFRFLEISGERMVRNPKLGMTFTDSKAIDSDGLEIGSSYEEYIGSYAERMDSRDYEGSIFLAEYLSILNPILNVSSVLFRAKALKRVLSKCLPEMQKARVAGDWILYSGIAAERGVHVGYIASPLNIHRRHSGSVTSALAVDRHLEEIRLCQQKAAHLLGVGKRSTNARANKYVQEMENALRSK